MSEVTTVVTERADTTTIKQLANVEVISMSMVKIVLVRALRVYLQTLIASITAFTTPLAAILGVSLSATDFWHILGVSAGIACAPAFMSFLMNALELATKWDVSHPTMRA